MTTPDAPPATLPDLLPDPYDADAAYDAFVEWAEGRGITLYPAQDEAAMELAAGSHVILSTPTGTGKSGISGSSGVNATASSAAKSPAKRPSSQGSKRGGPKWKCRISGARPAAPQNTSPIQ